MREMKNKVEGQTSVPKMLFTMLLLSIIIGLLNAGITVWLGKTYNLQMIFGGLLIGNALSEYCNLKGASIWILSLSGGALSAIIFLIALICFGFNDLEFSGVVKWGWLFILESVCLSGIGANIAIRDKKKQIAEEI